MTVTAHFNIRTGELLHSCGGYGRLGGREPAYGMPPADALTLMQGDDITLRVRPFDPWDDDEVVLLGASDTLIWRVKAATDHATTTVLADVADAAWDKPATTADNEQSDLATAIAAGWYVGTLDLGGSDLATLLPAGTSYLYCHGQLQWTTSAGVIKSSPWVPIILLSDIVRAGDDAVALSSQPSGAAPLYYKLITTLTGGGATALDGLSTVGKTKLLVLLVISDELQHWYLKAGTTAEDSASGIVRPDDYNASTNAQIWLRLL